MSEAEPHVFSAPLTVCLDIKSPQAYLAKDLVYALEDELGLRADWLPYLVPALSAPSQPRDSDDRGVRHRRHRAHYVERDIQRYAAVRGLVLRDLYRRVDSSVAAMALSWAGREGTPVFRRSLDDLFAGHWESRLDIEDLGAVTRVLHDAGVDLDGWQAYCADRGRRELAQLMAGLSAGGVFTGPAFVVKAGANAGGANAGGANAGGASAGDEGAAEIFYGRAHLPMIRWLLQGRSGPPPI